MAGSAAARRHHRGGEDHPRLLAGKDLGAYVADRMLRDAVERNLERISEASRHIPDDLKQTQPRIPWRQVADIGNVLRHAYQVVDHEQIWRTTQEDLGPLELAGEAMTRDLGSAGES